MLSKNTPELDSNGDEVHLFIVSTLAPRLPIILGPNITGKFSITTQNQKYGWLPIAYTEGCFIKELKGKGTGVNSNSALAVEDSIVAILRASSSNSIYKNNAVVQPKSLVLNYVIKY